MFVCVCSTYYFGDAIISLLTINFTITCLFHCLLDLNGACVCVFPVQLCNTIQLLTIEVLDPPENTNIDRGDSRGKNWYSVVVINVISNISIVNNCFVI